MNRDIYGTTVRLSALVILLAFLVIAPVLPSGAAQSEEELAKATQNPVAPMISVPFQNNWDFGIGPADAVRYTLNFQPVVPLQLNGKCNLIIRTIVPYIHAEAPVEGGDDESGLGDMTQSFFFSPSSKLNGWIVGVGPALYYPSATNDALGAEKWGAGPTVVALKQDHGLTLGVLSNHIWSFAGDEDRDGISSTFIQPFLSYTTSTYTIFGVNTESTYDWENSQWTVPINLSVTQMLKIHGLPLTCQLGYRYYAEAPDGGPDWGLRFTLTLLFPE
jgi:hypothetical protein